MQLTPIFNDAAHDGGEEMPGEGPTHPGTDDSGSAAVTIEAHQEEDRVHEENARPHRIWAEFDNTASSQAASETGPHPGMKYRSDPEAQALLEMLEMGRAKPKMAHNLKPSPHVERAVHTMHEEWREKSIRELQNELVASDDDLDDRYVLDTGFDDDFGPTF